jgi:lipopolysaccharide/colanic/teichoic acid biosynthesis glycosyltransferase
MESAMVSTALRSIERQFEGNGIDDRRSRSHSAFPSKNANFSRQKISNPEICATARDPSFSLQAMKRCLDIGAAGFALLLLVPLLVAIAIAIKLESKGPVLFRQLRYGRGGKLFRIYKFRTMYIDAGDLSGVRQTTRNDPRITPVGRFLRRMNLDELPQLVNIVRGEMSLVGPRPQVPGQIAGGMKYEYLVPYYFERHMVRPGLTGLAQVNNCRGSTAEPQQAIARINFDLDYIERWSLVLDFKIIARTIITEFILGRRGGY